MDRTSLVNTVAAALASMDLDIDMKGGATWSPSRNPKKDYSKWGVWEVWPNCRIGEIGPCLVGPVHVGGWIAWNSENGVCVPFEDKTVYTAQHQAEIMAVSQNQGKPTRVVDLAGNNWASTVRLKEVEKLLRPAVTQYEESNLQPLYLQAQPAHSAE